MYMYCHPLLWNNVLSGIHSKIIYDVLLTIYILNITSQHSLPLEHSLYTVNIISRLSMYLVGRLLHTCTTIQSSGSQSDWTSDRLRQRQHLRVLTT